MSLNSPTSPDNPIPAVSSLDGSTPCSSTISRASKNESSMFLVASLDTSSTNS